MNKLSAERIRPIRDEVYHRIRTAILRGSYRPGDRLQEETLALELGVSRTPVREALRKLEVERFVIYYPHKGTVVSEVSPDEVDELYQVRLQLEVFIARRAARNATEESIRRLRELHAEAMRRTDPDGILDNVEEFNTAVFELSGAPSLVELNQRVRLTLQRVLAPNYLDAARRKNANREHLRIIEALEARDPDMAERCVREHLAGSEKCAKPRVGSSSPE